ncbi:MAG TPA: cyclic nucleotide-binding domain-containing protein [Fimbriimonadaceae bacterium]|nr:cyclic nucleotide-binding domain-containing protein [Fimbriimonadaceae bacterium]HRJ96041.1 cyclic nucleotide-binding domain-containing protein [Fimbriimonadaceae bacterium]
MWDVFRSSYFAEGLTDEDVHHIIGIAEEVTYEDGEPVVRRADPNRDLFLVLEGVTVIEGERGQVLARIGSGRLLGEIALIDDKPRSATVVSVGQTRLALIREQRLKELMQQRPQMAVHLLRNIGRTLAERLRDANLQIEMLEDT